MTAIRHAIDVAASSEKCWQALVDLATWPAWFPFLRSVRADGDPFHVGGRFKMTLAVAPLMRVQVGCTVEEVDAPRKVRWVGGGFGVHGNHSYSLESRAPGFTRVTSHEDFSGVAARLLTGPIWSRLDGEVHRSMERFKTLVERS
jgi:hypothetical protein